MTEASDALVCLLDIIEVRRFEWVCDWKQQFFLHNYISRVPL